MLRRTAHAAPKAPGTEMSTITIKQRERSTRGAGSAGPRAPTNPGNPADSRKRETHTLHAPVPPSDTLRAARYAAAALWVPDTARRPLNSCYVVEGAAA